MLPLVIQKYFFFKTYGSFGFFPSPIYMILGLFLKSWWVLGGSGQWHSHLFASGHHQFVAEPRMEGWSLDDTPREQGHQNMHGEGGEYELLVPQTRGGLLTTQSGGC